jgi:hypothetical protein
VVTIDHPGRQTEAVTSPTDFPSTRDAPIRTDTPLAVDSRTEVANAVADDPAGGAVDSDPGGSESVGGDGEPSRRYAEAPAHARPMSSPAALIATLVVGILALGVCLLATVFGGLFGNMFTNDSPAAPVPPSTAATPTGVQTSPAEQFGDGQWLVGTDIRPGVYVVNVRADSTGCAWERDSSTDGTADSVLESGVGSPGQHLVIKIKSTDKLFHSQGCGAWKWIAAAPPEPTGS